MDSEQIRLVQKSFTRLAQVQRTPTAFYERLFELDPALRPLFKGSIEEQSRKLMNVLSAAVHSLHDFDALLPTVRSLGMRHRGYGIKDSDYDTVGQALMWTLEKSLGNDFTEDVRGAWAETYRVLSTVMKRSAAHARPSCAAR
jgi:hemoglobin-like flavoprotein